MDQPGKVANPAHGQLNRENIFLSAFAPENLVSRDGFGSPVPRQPGHLHTQAESGGPVPNASKRQFGSANLGSPGPLSDKAIQGF